MKGRQERGHVRAGPAGTVTTALFHRDGAETSLSNESAAHAVFAVGRENETDVIGHETPRLAAGTGAINKMHCHRNRGNLLDEYG